jgi:uncharacterized protein YndB with AHSA1/START domain
MSNLTLTQSFSIQATKSKVWKALTDPAIIKKYFFGTETITDWKAGSPIIFRGEWEGKQYVDKGTILEIENEKFIKYNYWSSFSGTPDVPENYNNITYAIKEANGETILTVTQDGFKDDEALKHSEANWKMVMEGMRKLVEDK